jgi:trk system potassium uptake protein TrkA
MHVRKGRIHSVTRLAESRGEILEMEAQPGSPLVSAPLKDLKFPENALLGAVVRGGVMQIPSGGMQVEPGERVVVYALPDAIPRVEKLCAAK